MRLNFDANKNVWVVDMPSHEAKALTKKAGFLFEPTKDLVFTFCAKQFVLVNQEFAFSSSPHNLSKIAKLLADEATDYLLLTLLAE